MTDLRKAAKFALEAMKKYCECGGLEDPIEALRQALAQPEQEKLYTKQDMIDVVEAVSIALQRKWVGMTQKEFQEATNGLEELEDCWIAIEAKLKEKNT